MKSHKISSTKLDKKNTSNNYTQRFIYLCPLNRSLCEHNLKFNVPGLDYVVAVTFEVQ